MVKIALSKLLGYYAVVTGWAPQASQLPMWLTLAWGGRTLAPRWERLHCVSLPTTIAYILSIPILSVPWTAASCTQCCQLLTQKPPYLLSPAKVLVPLIPWPTYAQYWSGLNQP